MQGWAGTEGDVARRVHLQNELLLETYRTDPKRAEQDANIERQIFEGGYSDRQLVELVQNAADALRSDPGRVSIVLTSDTLYVANGGAELTVKGVDSLMASHLSPKQVEEIGRFGLGFKSVLAISDEPQIFSRSGSLGFDRSFADQRIRDVVPTASRSAATRVARVLDAQDEAGKDGELEVLMSWATTVVRLPLARYKERLSEAIDAFPAHLVLFSPQIREFITRNDLTGRERVVTLSPSGDHWELVNGTQRSRWVVVKQPHRPSMEALVDGGYHASRETVEVSWAIPVQGETLRIGSFWAYFPTDEYTTLSGITNAPWKLSEDRRNVLKGAFNAEILERVVPKLVAAAWSSLQSSERPGLALDVMPARGKEARSWADDVINAPVMKALAGVRSIPDLDGVLQHPGTISMPPKDVEEATLTAWADACPRRSEWIHPSTSTTERRAKVERLLALHNRGAASVPEFLEALVPDGTPAQSLAAVKVAGMLLQDDATTFGDGVRNARILLLEDELLSKPRRESVFLRTGSSIRDDMAYIHPQLAGLPGAREALSQVGIQVLDPAGELRNELSQTQPRWAQVWELSRRLDIDDALEVFEDALRGRVLDTCQVRSHSGRWAPVGQLLLAGDIIPASGARDGEHLIDPRFHGPDEELLRRLGAVDKPSDRRVAEDELWVHQVRTLMRDTWRRELKEPNIKYESILLDGSPVPGPLQLLDDMSEEGRLRLTDSVLARFEGRDWRAFHSSRPSRSCRLRHPMWHRLRDHGRLDTNLGPMPVAYAVRPLTSWEDEPLPQTTTATEQALDSLGVVSAVEDLPADAWTYMLRQAGKWTDEERRVRLYSWAAECAVPAPPTIRARVQVGHAESRPAETAVTADEEVCRSLALAGIPALLAREEDVNGFVEFWGLAHGEDMLQEEVVTTPTGEPVLLLDRFPALEVDVPEEDADLMLQSCASIEVLTSTPTGQKTRPLVFRREADTLCVTGTTDEQILQQCILGLKLDVTVGAVQRRTRDMMERQVRNEVRKATDNEERLLLAVGEAALRSRLPDTALSALGEELGRELSAIEVARLAIAVHGYAVLREHRDALQKMGLQPPKHWAGLRPAREWAHQLGFPTEWAGFPADARPAEFTVEGPIDLPPLHDYQREVATKVQRLLEPDAERNRGLVSLPTGAGKTRVAVEALINHARTTGTPARVVWVAQSDELCEQAVQAWSHLWRAIGPRDMVLSVGRLWGGNHVSEAFDSFHVVVATPEKINGLDLESYAWLPQPDVIVIDEAHTSINQEGNELLRRLGNVRLVPQLRTPLLGLTATPFRGENEDETQRLVDRYHGNKLDDGAFGGAMPLAYLQQEGVLARVRHVVLDGVDVQPTPEELRALREMHRMPQSIESRLGERNDRNRTIIDSILGLDEKASVLVFATSVQNARALAAMLSFHGVSARSVESNTDPSARRRYVEDFKEGHLRVLTNYGVFAQGFDVPGVDAVYVTRPTYSPNLYQQMIGRGLRGPLNGGREEVTIVNIADNIEQHGEQLAFHHFDYLWGGDR